MELYSKERIKEKKIELGTQNCYAYPSLMPFSRYQNLNQRDFFSRRYDWIGMAQECFVISFVQLMFSGAIEVSYQIDKVKGFFGFLDQENVGFTFEIKDVLLETNDKLTLEIIHAFKKKQGNLKVCFQDAVGTVLKSYLGDIKSNIASKRFCQYYLESCSEELDWIFFRNYPMFLGLYTNYKITIEQRHLNELAQAYQEFNLSRFALRKYNWGFRTLLEELKVWIDSEFSRFIPPD